MSAQHTPGPWPKHPDGRPMRLGEMTPEQRRARAKAAVQQVAAEMQANAPAITKVLADFDAEHAAIAKATGSTYVDCGECPRISTGCKDRCAKATGSEA